VRKRVRATLLELEESSEMKPGLLEKILIRRYGQPISCVRDGMVARCWNSGDLDNEALLYMGMKWDGRVGLRFASLSDIYGDSFGGILIKNVLRVAMLSPRQLFAVWNIEELRMLPPVREALAIDPAIDFFMDAANVEYFGHKAGELYVFDTETDELDCLGPIEPALEALMDQWEEAGRPEPGN
jgi:hypothetical protein